MDFRAQLERLFHVHAWETTAYTEELGPIEQQCRCSDYRHKSIDGKEWLDGPHVSAELWRAHITNWMKANADLFMRS